MTYFKLIVYCIFQRRNDNSAQVNNSQLLKLCSYNNALFEKVKRPTNLTEFRRKWLQNYYKIFFALVHGRFSNTGCRNLGGRLKGFHLQNLQVEVNIYLYTVDYWIINLYNHPCILLLISNYNVSVWAPPMVHEQNAGSICSGADIWSSPGVHQRWPKSTEV